jgi:hypothetical protein
MVADRVADVLIERGGEFNHGYTYSGHPVACAVALANLAVIRARAWSPGARRHRPLPAAPLAGAGRAPAGRGGAWGRHDRRAGTGGAQGEPHLFPQSRQGRAGMPRPLLREWAGHAGGLRHHDHFAAADAVPRAGRRTGGEGLEVPGPHQEKVLNVYNWSDYIAEDTIAAFESRTGIKVNYDVFDSNEVLETKLLAGRTGYDVVVPSGLLPGAPDPGRRVPEARQVEAANLANMDPEIMERVPRTIRATSMRSTTCGARPASATTRRRSRSARHRLPSTAGPLIFDPENAAKLQPMRAHAARRPRRGVRFGAALLSRPRPEQRGAEDLAAAEELLMKIRPFVRYLHSSQYINDLANGEICVAVGWSGDVLQARDRAPRRPRRRGRVRDPEGGRDHVVRHAGHPGRRAATPRTPTPSSTT